MSDLGMKNRLSFIKTYDNIEDINNDSSLKPGSIIIDASQSDPKLKYLKEEIMLRDGMREISRVWITIDGSDSPISSSRMSDLESQLRKRDWNITERIFTDSVKKNNEINSSSSKTTTSSPITTSLPTTTTPLPSFSTITPPFSSDEKIEEEEKINWDEGNLYLYVGDSCLAPIYNLDNDINLEEKDPRFVDHIQVSETFDDKSISDFNKLYEELIIKKQMKSLTLNGEEVKDNNGEKIYVNLGAHYYYNLISTKDLNTGSSIIDLISLAGSQYTNILNLNQILHHILSSPNIKECRMVIGIQFTHDLKQYSNEISFPILNESDSYSSMDNIRRFISNIQDKVTVEFHDGCLRVFPNSEKVTECIIGYCYLNYEGLF